jgi:hypothetical protein
MSERGWAGCPERCLTKIIEARADREIIRGWIIVCGIRDRLIRGGC